MVNCKKMRVYTGKTNSILNLHTLYAFSDLICSVRPKFVCRRGSAPDFARGVHIAIPDILEGARSPLLKNSTLALNLFSFLSGPRAPNP